MRLLLTALLSVAVSASASAQATRTSDFEVVHIDGKKDPEMIPEWSAWEAALTALAGGPGLLPDVLVPYFSKAEAALLLQQAEAHVKREREYHDRVKRLHREGAGDDSRIRDRNREITLEYRWAILRARDRLLEALNSAAQAELRRFVEWMKQGTTVTILRKDLPFFLQPQ